MRVLSSSSHLKIEPTAYFKQAVNGNCYNKIYHKTLFTNKIRSRENDRMLCLTFNDIDLPKFMFCEQDRAAIG
jgi:hypothetical protein